MKKKISGIVLLIFLMGMVLAGCGDTKSMVSEQLIYEGSMELKYAQQFTVDYYQDGYTLISIADGGRYLVVPEGKTAPDDLAEDVTVLLQPLQNIYLVASAAMDMVCELDSLKAVRFSGQRAENWCITEAAAAMEQGSVLYAGKYNMPDYELILSEGCSLTIENNMISHSPEVVEKLESFGIPVLIDFSSYESHPLGRVEWIKLYGVLLGKEAAAQQAFEKQCEILEHMEKNEASGKTVAFFYITTNGMVNTRCSSDYIPKMIQLAGGTYIFEDLGGKEGSRASVTIQMEEFYHVAKDADYLIYNNLIDEEVESIGDLLQKEALLKDFKAVQNGNVWCTTRDLYQQSMSIGEMIEAIHCMLSDEEAANKEMSCLYLLEQD